MSNKNFKYTCFKCGEEQTQICYVENTYRKYTYDFKKGGYYKKSRQWGGDEMSLECPACGEDITNHKIIEKMTGGFLDE